MKKKLTKQEMQLWQYIEKHFQDLELDRFKALIKSISLKKKEKGAT